MKTASIKKNFFMESLLAMSSFIFPLITFPYVSRVLGPEGTGTVSFATSLISYFNMFAQLGIPKYGIRACAQVRDDREKLSQTVQELFLINLMTTAISYVLLLLALAVVPQLQRERKLYLIVSATIFFNTIGMEWLYKSLEKYTYITIRSVVCKAIALVAMFLMVRSKEDYISYGFIAIFASSASNLFNFLHSFRYIDLKKKWPYALRRHMKPVLIFFAMACASTIYTQLDTVMLGFMTSSTEVGYYNAAVKVKVILVSIVTSLGTVLLPRSSYYVKNGMMNQFRAVSAKAIRYIIFTSLPLSVYFILFAKEGIIFLSGNEYLPSVRPMQIIMPTLFLIGLSNILGTQILVSLGREKVVLRSQIAGAVSDLLLNFLLIPYYGASGAALGTVVAEAAVVIVQGISLKVELTDLRLGPQFGRVLLAMALGVATCIWVKWIAVSNFIRLVISAVLFFGCYAGCLYLQKEPIMMEVCAQLERMVFRRRKGMEDPLNRA